MTFLDYLHQCVGKNWVIHRRTERILRRYGSDVVCLSAARYAKLKADYERETGLSADGYFLPPGSPSQGRLAAAIAKGLIP